ncbi:hypothetical protein OAR97_02110 [Arcobacteraceae bacterium]|nr:hypothetical protein [Arcobacteraceae bacterium]
MTKMNKISIFLGLIVSLTAIWDWLSDRVNIGLYIVNKGKEIVISILDFFWTVITFDIQLWVIILFVSVMFIYFKFKNHYLKENESSFVKEYESLTDNERIIYDIIAESNEKRKKCIYNSILRNINQRGYNISHLESHNVIKKLITKDLIYKQDEWMDDSHFVLTDKGQTIAIYLITKSKNIIRNN